MKTIKIHSPLTNAQLKPLKVSDLVFYTGELYTMRDQAHRRLFELYKRKKRLPFDPAGKVIYYCGPTPAPRGACIGSCGPTTSERMDAYTYFLIDKGVKAFVGKGERSAALVGYFFKHKCLYFLAVGGAGAYYAQRVSRCESVCFKDLGPEAVYKLSVHDFPLIVGIDTHRQYIYSRFQNIPVLSGENREPNLIPHPKAY